MLIIYQHVCLEKKPETDKTFSFRDTRPTSTPSQLGLTNIASFSCWACSCFIPIPPQSLVYQVVDCSGNYIIILLVGWQLDTEINSSSGTAETLLSTLPSVTKCNLVSFLCITYYYLFNTYFHSSHSEWRGRVGRQADKARP